MAKKQETNKKIIYAVGIEYDDFSDGGFQIYGVCDTVEDADKLIEAFVKEHPKFKKWDVVVRIYEMNRLYEDWEIDRL